MSSVKSQGYIPSSGVWTVEERAKAQEVAEHYAGIVSIPWDESEAGRAVNTVFALIAALEDEHVPCDQYGDCATCDLLKSLK